MTPFLLEPSWQEALSEELNKPYLLHLAAFLERERRFGSKPVYPPQELVFSAFQYTPFHAVQVVIMGQDPYHGPGQAHGLSFSVPRGVKPPPSLLNIFKERASDLEAPIPDHGCLVEWARQGVLLLNATLTVSEGEPLSHHGKGWELFTDAVIRALKDREDPLIFVLWGKSAQEKGRCLEETVGAKRHFILKAPHPSPYSAHQGFFGSRPFSQINTLLAQQGKRPIVF